MNLLGAALAALAAAACSHSVSAQSSFAPTAAFVQAGTAQDTHQVAIGLTWDWTRRWNLWSGEVSGYWEGSISQWSYPGADDRRTAWLAQVGAIPVFRYRPDGGASPWFFEGGVGVTFTTNVYETDRKRFSTSFNFGDHLALGRNFGTRREHELSLRFEHYSNAGIKHPNPGENFVQLRYLRRFE
jgi:hypothetical protein